VQKLQDRTGAAIEQLQLAQMQRNTDFYTQSIVDARLRELKERHALETAK
jgi:predicted Zn-dependent protease